MSTSGHAVSPPFDHRPGGSVLDRPGDNLEEAEAAYKRVAPEALALTELQLSAHNVDIVAASSVILGVAHRVVTFREAIAAEFATFDIRNVDCLVDRAKAAWYVAITTSPAAEPEVRELEPLLGECAALRERFLAWAAGLVHAKHFEQAAIDAIKRGAGKKDLAGDVVALASLYRRKWADIRGMCGVTEADLDRAARIGADVFASVARCEQRSASNEAERSRRLHVRRFWTLADRSYRQCRRAILYLRYDEGDGESIAPSLRRNSGPRRRTSPPA
jgi:hypothetical protein